jgi:metal-dependent HD superfamily phosphatase/phosphodiesterase
MDELPIAGNVDPLPTGPPATETSEGRIIGPGVPDSSEEERQQKRELVFKRHYKKSHLEKKLDDKLKKECPDGKLCQVVMGLLNDPLVASIQNYANVVSIQRLGYNDHGPVHARIVALNSLRIMDLLNEGGVPPSVVAEEVATMDDARVAVFLGAFLHDLGMAVTRDDHERHSMQMADSILDKHLSNVYDDEGQRWMIKCLVNECIIGHMGNYRIHSVEAGCVMIGDGADCTRGRAQIPVLLSKHPMLGDIHRFSASAITEVRIIKGQRKPVRIEVEMTGSAGLFQVEEVLIGKAKVSPIMNFLEVAAYLEGKERLYLQ